MKPGASSRRAASPSSTWARNGSSGSAARSRGARNITRGELEILADTEAERRDPSLADRSQKIVLTCGGGGKATLSANALIEMGFTDVAAIDGGCRGWQAAGFPLVAWKR
jgi:rhodanese-related sulfurtransferase